MVMAYRYELENEIYSNKSELDVIDGIKSFLNENGNNSKDTRATYESSLRGFSKNFFNKDLYDITKQELESVTLIQLEKYKNYLMKTNKNGTVVNRMTAIREMLRYLAKWKYIKFDISDLDLIKNLPDDSEETEMIPVDKLMDYVDYFEKNERNGKEKKWIALLMFETAFRAEEAVSLKKSEISKDGDTYIIKKKGKGNKEAIKRIGKDVYNEIINLNPNTDEVFKVSYYSMKTAFNKANNYFSDKSKYTSHSIRKLAITEHYKLTKCIVSTMKFANHSNMTTTQKYLKLEDDIPVGTYTRMISTGEDKYKTVELSELVSVIDTLPTDIKDLINLRLTYGKV